MAAARQPPPHMWEAYQCEHNSTQAAAPTSATILMGGSADTTTTAQCLHQYQHVHNISTNSWVYAEGHVDLPKGEDHPDVTDQQAPMGASSSSGGNSPPTPNHPPYDPNGSDKEDDDDPFGHLHLGIDEP